MDKYNDDIWIDPHLKFAIAYECNKQDNEITQQFLSTLRELNLSDKGIKSLHGLEYAKNLNTLLLNNNNLTNVNIISNLTKLRTLELKENRIEDITFLTNLINIKSIDLSSNNIQTVPNLYELKKLQLINISNNKIQDFSFVDKLYNDNMKILAKNQFIYLTPSIINHNEDYEFNPILISEDENIINFSNIQICGEYKDLITDEKPCLEYSISKATIKNITSNCLIRATFYHEIHFYKSIVLSGTFIQPIIIKDNMKLNKDDNFTSLYSVTGKLLSKDKQSLNDKLVTIIDSKGNKYHSITDCNGVYRFTSLIEDRYTLLFPFLSDYNYISPSLYVINLKDDKYININALVSSK